VGPDEVAAAPAVGQAIHGLVEDLYPLFRSITGAGLRATLRRIGETIPLEHTEVPTGTHVFDWTVPDEWSITDAYVEDATGRRWVDFHDSNLHVVNYSAPVDEWMTLDALRPHLHTLADHPDWIPYRTSYYVETWGFCLADRVARAMPEGRYHAVIRSRLAPGALSLAEHVHRGERDEEVLVFAHCCHPSLCNDNLSGIGVATHLAKHLAGRRTRYTYRFVFAPATIGSIAWLALHRDGLARIRHGLVLSLLGDPGPLHYKRSRFGDVAIDRAAHHVLATHHAGARFLEFTPWGYDERQFGSPGIALPVGRLTRTPNGEFAQYHTSADDPAFVRPEALGDSWLACLRIFAVLEGDARYVNQSPMGEPQLGRRGLYGSSGGHTSIPNRQLVMLWLLNQSDGRTSLLDIAEHAGQPFDAVAAVARELVAAGLLVRAGDAP
jgi:aminopeptidase-like protein